MAAGGGIPGTDERDERLATVTRIVASPGQRDRLLTILGSGATLLAGRAGCEAFVVGAATDDADAVVVFEVWTSIAHRRAAMADPVLREHSLRAVPLIAASPDQQHLDRAAVLLQPPQP